MLSHWGTLLGHKSGRQNDDGEAQPLRPEHTGGQHSTDAYLVKSKGEPGGMAPPEWASDKSRSEILENSLDRWHSTPECFQVVLCFGPCPPPLCVAFQLIACNHARPQTSSPNQASESKQHSVSKVSQAALASRPEHVLEALAFLRSVPF